MKDMSKLIITLIVVSVIFIVTIVNVTTQTIDIEPTSDFVTFSDYKSNYRLHKDTEYRTERIFDDLGTVYYIYLETKNGRMVVEYEDTIIDGQFTFAKHWCQSFIANFEDRK